MTAKEALDNANLKGSKSYEVLDNLITSYDELVKEHELTIKLFNSANEQLNELEKDVKRYFELQNMWNWKQRKEWTDELDAEYKELRIKLEKVGKEE